MVGPQSPRTRRGQRPTPILCQSQPQPQQQLAEAEAGAEAEAVAKLALSPQAPCQLRQLALVHCPAGAGAELPASAASLAPQQVLDDEAAELGSSPEASEDWDSGVSDTADPTSSGSGSGSGSD